MSDLFKTELQKMQEFAAFGEAVIELAKEKGIIPKRQQRKVVVRTKTVVQYRKPRGPNKPKEGEVVETPPVVREGGM